MDLDRILDRDIKLPRIMRSPLALLPLLVAVGAEQLPGSTQRSFLQRFERNRVTRQFNFDFVPKPTEIIPFLQRTDSVLPYVVSPVLCSLLESCVTVYALKKYHPIMPADPTGLNVLGVLLSLTTVFRTQQAYSRYWESRGHLGQLMAAVVDAASAASVALASGERAGAPLAAARAELARLLKLYFAQVEHCLQEATHATKARSDYWRPAEKNAAESRELLRFRALDADLDGSVSDDEAATASIADAMHHATPDEAHALGRLALRTRPALVLRWVRTSLHERAVRGRLAAGADANARARLVAATVGPALAQIQVQFNGCNKIATTPFPAPYMQMNRVLRFVFCYTLPFNLAPKLGGWVVPLAALFAFGYYGLDAAATQLQDPFVAAFGDTALDGRFVRATSADVDAVLVGE